MKRVIALLLCLVMVVVMFAACSDNGGEKTHEHTYRDTWSSDANNHWYDATCDCEDAPIVRLPHTDKNNDGKCDICEFTDHTHTYAEGWTADCTNHWHAADCGHTVAGTDVAAHVDADKDGKCDVCAYIIEDIHVHLYDTEWTTDGEYHWYAPICEHANATVEKLAHEINAAGYCTVCGEKINDVDLSDLGAVLAAAVARNDKVVGGNVVFTQVARESADDEPRYIYDIYYTLGNGHSYINYVTIDPVYGYNSSNQQWYEQISEDEIFAIESLDGGLTFSQCQGTPAKLNGYTYTPSTLLSGAESNTTLAETLLTIYALSENAFDPTEENGLVEKNISYDPETGIYTMNFTLLNIKEIDISENQGADVEEGEEGEQVVEYISDLFTVEAIFTIDENYVIDYAELVVNTYTGADRDMLEIYTDYEYDFESGVLTMYDTALADTYTYIVAQNSGERTYTSAYPKAAVLPQSFDLFYDGELVGDSMNLDAREYFELALGNIFPTTADLSMIGYNDIEIKLIKAEDIDNPDAAGIGYYYYNKNDNAICGYAPAAGAYILTITYGDCIHQITINSKAAAPESIKAYGFDSYEDWLTGETVYEVTESTAVTAVTLKPGEIFNFIVAVNPRNSANQTYTVNIDNGELTQVDMGEVTVFYELFSSYTAYQFSSDTEGVYTVTMTATEDETVTSTLVITVSNEEESGGDEGEGGASSITCTLTETYGWVDKYTYVAGAAGTYTFHVPAGYGVYSVAAWDAWGDPEVDFYGNDNGASFTVTLTEGQAYSFYVGGLTNGDFVIDVDVPNA